MADPKSQKPQVRPDPAPEDKTEADIDQERADSGPASDPPSMGGSTAGGGPDSKKSKPPVPHKDR
jgi:hypothetical protein